VLIEPVFEGATAQLPDEAVVDRVRAGETELFEVLMRRHNQRLYRAIRAVLRRDSDVEDVMQQAYLAAFTHLAQFAGQAKFSTWLLRIGVNEALGRLRRSGRLVALEGDVDEAAEEAKVNAMQPVPFSPEDRAADRELASLLERSIDGLPDSYRQVLVLRLVEGLSTEETAEVLGVREETVKQRLHRARAMVQRSIEDRIGATARSAFLFHADRCDRVVSAVMSHLDAR
jgi:RNA polymerase sigma-70 factor (ECF subfamily)